MWCDAEREESHANKAQKADDIVTLTGDISDLDDTVNNEESGLKQQLKEKNEELKENRVAQETEKKERKAQVLVYFKEITNLQEAEKTLDKALDVLTKFYAWLKKKSGPHHFEEKIGKDSGGHNIKQMKEATVEELEKACSEDPHCMGFNTAGYLKSEIQAEEKWYDTEETLYVKVYDESLVAKGKGTVTKKEDPAPPEVWSKDDKAGSKAKGNDVIGMIQQILDETKAEEAEVHTAEEANQHAFEDERDELKQQEKDCLNTITDLEEEIASKEDTIEKKHDEKFQTE